MLAIFMLLKILLFFFYTDLGTKLICTRTTSSHTFADSLFSRSPILQKRKLRLIPLLVAQGKVRKGVCKAVCLK